MDKPDRFKPRKAKIAYIDIFLNLKNITVLLPEISKVQLIINLYII